MAKRFLCQAIQRSVVSSEVCNALKAARAICFDVDSTVIREEGIDSLAGFLQLETEVAALTKRAMEGDMTFESSLEMRLNLLRPSKSSLETFLRENPATLTDGVENLISEFHKQGKHVYLVSGGFKQIIYPIADKLGIPRHRVVANNFLFSSDGGFRDFDRSETTSRSGGKREAIRQLKDWHGYSSVVMIGDGATDLEAKPAADIFIGFGGVVEREVVRRGADWYITSFQELQEVLCRDM